MKYLTAITSLIILNTFAVITLLYFGNFTGKIEKENKQLEIEILKLNEQLKINEVEYNLYNNYSYLKKLQKIYFDANTENLHENNFISLKDFNNTELKNIYMVSSN